MKRARIACVVVAAVAMAGGNSANAVTRDWVCGSSSWSVASCWSPTGLPQAGDDVDLVQAGAGNVTVTYDASGAAPTEIDSLDVAGFGAGSMTLSTLFPTPTAPLSMLGMSVGNGGVGIVEQTLTTFSVGIALTIGANGGSGSYTLESATLDVSGGTEIIGSGVGGTGQFVQSNGTHTVQHQQVGTFGGAGSITLLRGTHRVDDELDLGVTAGSIGDYTSLGNLRAGNMFIGLGGRGTLRQRDGTVTVQSPFAPVGDLFIGYASTGVGQFRLEDGTLSVAGNETVGFDGAGLFRQLGGVHTVAGDITIAANAGSAGTLSVSGGTVTASAILNHDQFTFTGGTINADITNSNRMDIGGAGSRTIHGDVLNELGATLKVTGDPGTPAPGFGTVVTYSGTATNFGTWISDPVHQIFNDLINGSTGVMSGVAGDKITILGDFTNNSEEAVAWETSLVALAFEGSGPHQFSVASEDVGSAREGYDDNFAWGALSLGTGVALELLDGNPLNAGAALYVGLFELADGIGQLASITGNIDIFYDAALAGNGYLAGGSYALGGGGFLQAVVPGPSSAWLFVSGIIGLIPVARKRR